MTAELELWAERANPTSRMFSVAEKIDVISSVDDGQLDPSIIQIMESILGATDEDSIFAAANAGTTAGKNFLGVPFLLKGSGITWKRSAEVYREGNGFPWYALMKVTNLQTGEIQTINCGGWTFVFCLWRLSELNVFEKYEAMGGMPMVLNGKNASSGFTVVIPSKYIMPKMPNASAKTSKSKTES